MKDFEKSWGLIDPNYLVELKSETAILNLRRTRLFLESILSLQVLTFVILFVVSRISAIYEFQHKNAFGLVYGFIAGVGGRIPHRYPIRKSLC